ncbi:hypothetical protein [Rhodopirellula sp. SWK7]|uniref:hypothetical protein n=1 Tax=Rhodopirellula sp. SWK7 TaxID=595460 RepID=UPI0002BFA4DE|nr:hypothetical protein [Rhodopirellula sp. SWK7]EMI45970.1 signal peptide protein [Rhodopirellula sp. SWK7]
MSRRRAGISPSLFPFLAVLICTLGTLILLLALVAQQANDAAVAQVEQEKQEKLAATAVEAEIPVASAKLTPPVSTPAEEDATTTMSASVAERLIEQEQFRVSQLVSFRDEQTAELERKRDEITQIESHMRKIQAELAELNAEVDTAMAEGESPIENIRTDEKTLVLMREEAAKLRAEIEELESSERGKKPRVVIVPHRGPNGTQRRPVYVLCTADGLQILPEGARITKAQALAATETDNPRSNPLGAALGIARMHAMQQYGDQLPPYPLLIVRPDGIYMYRVASALMKDWDDQYGYELVPGEVDLAFPGGDNVLRKNMELAIHEAAARNYHFASGIGGGGRGNGSGGSGFGSTSVPGRYNDRTEQPAGGSYASGQSGMGQPEMTQLDSGQSRAGQPDSGQPQNSGQYASATQPRAGASGRSPSRQPARSLPTLSARDLDRQAQSNGFSMARDQQFNSMTNVFAEPPGSRSGSYGAAGSVTSQSEALNDFLQGKKPPGLEDAAESGGTPGGSGSGSQGENTPGSSAAGQSSVAAGGSSAGSSSQAPPPGAQPGQSGQTAMSQSSSQSPHQMSPVAMKLSDPGQSGAANSAQSGSASESNQDASQSPQSPQVAQKMVRREGKDWALPDAMRGIGGTEFVRPISLRCHHDRFELVEQGQVVQTFRFEQQDVYRPTLQLATAIRDRVMGWGATMQGGYWKPQLEVSVGPHAEQRFHELEILMQGSGVDVVRRTP